jgi:hypothetical protein
VHELKPPCMIQTRISHQTIDQSFVIYVADRRRCLSHTFIDFVLDFFQIFQLLQLCSVFAVFEIIGNYTGLQGCCLQLQSVCIICTSARNCISESFGLNISRVVLFVYIACCFRRQCVAHFES